MWLLVTAVQEMDTELRTTVNNYERNDTCWYYDGI